MGELQQLINDARDLVDSYRGSLDQDLFIDQSRRMLDEIKAVCNEKTIQEFAQNIVFGIYPHVQLTDAGKEYFASLKVDATSDDPDSWSGIASMGLFLIGEEEASFIRSLRDIDEKTAVCILCAVGKINSSILEEEYAYNKNHC